MQRHQQYHQRAQDEITAFHNNVVSEVQQAITQHDVVVVGMFLNPYVLWVRFVLSQANVSTLSAIS